MNRIAANYKARRTARKVARRLLLTAGIVRQGTPTDSDEHVHNRQLHLVQIVAQVFLNSWRLVS